MAHERVYVEEKSRLLFFWRSCALGVAFDIINTPDLVHKLRFPLQPMCCFFCAPARLPPLAFCPPGLFYTACLYIRWFCAPILCFLIPSILLQPLFAIPPCPPYSSWVRFLEALFAVGRKSRTDKPPLSHQGIQTKTAGSIQFQF
ncbi:hypothetical protein CEXT_142861 [Caerostris extrusa]|uniref:Uncharacterized protein n=1 Tax=Caerostris extrusa TaxID=172846 RepID=A0AAV4RY04_CAEEX|nr:hypothetical protein CEXT_142861 [Caerostris extrusa]